MADRLQVYEWYCEGCGPDKPLRLRAPANLQEPVERSFGQDADERGGVRVLFNDQPLICDICGGAGRRRPRSDIELPGEIEA